MSTQETWNREEIEALPETPPTDEQLGYVDSNGESVGQPLTIEHTGTNDAIIYVAGRDPTMEREDSVYVEQWIKTDRSLLVDIDVDGNTAGEWV